MAGADAGAGMRERPKSKLDRRQSKSGRYSIIWSARTRIDCGNTMPSVFAVRRIDDQLEFCRFFNRQLGGFRTLEDLINARRGTAEQFSLIDRVRHQTAIVGENPERIDNRKAR